MEEDNIRLKFEPPLPPVEKCEARRDCCEILAGNPDYIDEDSELYRCLRDQPETTDGDLEALLKNHDFVKDIPVTIRIYDNQPFPKIQEARANCAAVALSFRNELPNSFVLLFDDREKEPFSFHLAYGSGPALKYRPDFADPWTEIRARKAQQEQKKLSKSMRPGLG
ncbi:MAG: hypothetical protein ABF959_07120 [Gluconobacter albidus]